MTKAVNQDRKLLWVRLPGLMDNRRPQILLLGKGLGLNQLQHRLQRLLLVRRRDRAGNRHPLILRLGKELDPF